MIRNAAIMRSPTKVMMVGAPAAGAGYKSPTVVVGLTPSHRTRMPAVPSTEITHHSTPELGARCAAVGTVSVVAASMLTLYWPIVQGRTPTSAVESISRLLSNVELARNRIEPAADPLLRRLDAGASARRNRRPNRRRRRLPPSPSTRAREHPAVLVHQVPNAEHLPRHIERVRVQVHYLVGLQRPQPHRAVLDQPVPIVSDPRL